MKFFLAVASVASESLIVHMDPHMLLERRRRGTLFPAVGTSVRRQVATMFRFDVSLNGSLVAKVLAAQQTHMLLTTHARLEVLQQFIVSQEHGVASPASVESRALVTA